MTNPKNNEVLLTKKDKQIILMGLLDMGAMLAMVTGRLLKANKMSKKEHNDARHNIVNIQSVVSQVLEIDNEDITKAAAMSQMITPNVQNVAQMIEEEFPELYEFIKDKLNDDDDDNCDLNGLKDLLN